MKRELIDRIDDAAICLMLASCITSLLLCVFMGALGDGITKAINGDAGAVGLIVGFGSGVLILATILGVLLWLLLGKDKGKDVQP